MLRSQSADFPFNRAELRLPSSLPVFRGSGISDPDAFIEQLSNNLLAHGISPCRWTSALLLGCAEPADASFVRESLLNVEWDDACQRFLSRFRDPLYFHMLQTEFYTMRKTPSENMLSYSARFERTAYKLDLKDSRSLVPLYIASLPNPLAAQLQLLKHFFFLTHPFLTHLNFGKISSILTHRIDTPFKKSLHF